jgi:hypothetical protein
MKIFRWMQDIVQFLLNGVSRLFEPTDDNYPQTGVQPFSGEPGDKI